MSRGARPGMTSRRWQEVGRLFDVAVGLEPASRRAYLDGLCGEEAGLRDEVESLLAAEEGGATFFGDGAAGLLAADLAEGEEADGERTGSRLGAYRLIREIGRGGMSRVYLGERVDDRMRQRVAVKCLSTAPHWHREERLRRFRAEGTMLAVLSHPHIAQVFDAGVDAAGDPYLVMEYVDGEPITSWCTNQGPSLDAVLDLFLDVCDAVEHAHRRLIVHRDLKPSNILVDGDGRVKLLDFGIGKLLAPEQHGLGDEEPPTRRGLLPMTPEYAAPEQLRGEPVTTATDVYGLGLLLFELLTGERPFDLAGLSPGEIEQIVCETVPRRPSATGAGRGRAVARTAGPPVGGTARGLDRDLDAIVLRALEKEPERRYGSARELADDLRRARAGHPVTARPATVGYRLGKFVRRRRRTVALAATLAVLLAAMVAYHLGRLRVERDQARIEARRAEEVTGLLRDVFLEADPRRSGGPTTVDELLDRGVERAMGLETDPLIQAELLHFLALAQFGRGGLAAAEPLFERALELRRRHLTTPHLDLVESLNHLGWLRLATGDFAAAAELFSQARAAHRGWPGGDTDHLAHAIRGLALARSGLRDHVGAEALLRQAVETQAALVGRRHAYVADALQDLGVVLRKRRDLAAAYAAFDESLAIRRALYGDRHPAVAESLHQLALLAEDGGDPTAARRLHERALSIRLAALGADHPRTVEVRQDLAALD